MDKVSDVKLSSVGLAWWLFIVVMTSIAFAPFLHADQKHVGKGAEKYTASNWVTIFMNTGTRQIASMQPKPGPTLKKMLNETARDRIPLSLRGKQRGDPWRETLGSIKSKIMEDLLHPIILRAANLYQVDLALIKAIIMVESRYDPRAISIRGAKGLMQLMPKTAALLGVKDSFNPEENIDAGVRHFKFLLNQFKGNIKLALAAYHAGSRRVREYRGIPPFPSTRLYIKRVFEYYLHYKGKIT